MSVLNCKAQSMHYGSQYCCLQWLDAIVTMLLHWPMAMRTTRPKFLIKSAALLNDRPHYLILHSADMSLMCPATN